jgi:hypothetical protein
MTSLCNPRASAVTLFEGQREWRFGRAGEFYEDHRRACLHRNFAHHPSVRLSISEHPTATVKIDNRRQQVIRRGGLENKNGKAVEHVPLCLNRIS